VISAARLRRELIGSPWTAGVTVLTFLFLGWLALRLGDWAIVRAVFRADAEACRMSLGTLHAGACWGVIAEKGRAILFGRYPLDQQWRPAVATLLLLGLAALSAWPRCWRASLAIAWVLALLVFFGLMRGASWLGLPPVPSTRWGGLPLTLLLALVGLALAFPLGILLALGRRSDLPVARTLCRTYIELVRGVPLISVLFMASFLLPLLLPGWGGDVLLRVLAGLALFAAAYLAEVVRGGLQSVPAGQADSARALGLSPWQVHAFVVLPQALRAVVPALMNSVIGTLKDSSLVTVVGLYDLTGALSLALGGDPTWRPFYLEGYLFVAALYWTLCFSLSRYSRWIEGRLRTPT
jgi:general L-amino acid transport system permease protein